MKIKQWFVMIVVVILVVTASACIGNKDIDMEPVEIHFQSLLPENFSTDPLMKPLLDAVTDYNQLHPNMKVIVDYMDIPVGTAFSDTRQNLIKRLESDTAPDIVDTTAVNIQIAESKGLLRDLLPLVTQELDIPQQVLDYGMINGKLLSLPFGAHPSAIFFNKELFDEAKIPYPEDDWTWDQFRDISKKMKDHESMLPYDFTMLDMLLSSTGNGVLSPDGTTSVGYLDSPEAVRMLQWLNASYHDDANGVVSDINDIFGGFDGLQAGMFVGGLGDHFHNFEGDNKKRLGVAPLPYFTGGQRVNPMWFSGYGISQKSKHSEEAWEFIQYLTLEVNNHSLQLAAEYIPTSNAVAEAAGANADPTKRVYIEELKYAVQLSSGNNPFYVQAARNEELKEIFGKLVVAKDEEIAGKLHELALKLDGELKRLELESEKQSESVSP